MLNATAPLGVGYVLASNIVSLFHILAKQIFKLVGHLIIPTGREAATWAGNNRN